MYIMGTGSRAGTKELGGGDREQGGRQRAGWWGTGSRAGTKDLGGSRVG